MNPFEGPPKGRCVNCKNRLATLWWTSEGIVAAVHGCYAAWCEICCVEAQLAHAQEMAASISGLEVKLAELLLKDV